MDEGNQLVQAGPASLLRRLAPVLTICVVLAALLAIGGVVLWRNYNKPKTLLPATITQEIKDFTPYFYAGQMPAGYTFDATKASLDQGVLILPLTSSDSNNPTIVLTEQSIPDSVSQQDLQKGGDQVQGTIAPATINSIEGRLLGTMIVSKSQGRTLILLNAPGNADKADLTALLQGLRLAR